jgi:hypothetical protein
VDEGGEGPQRLERAHANITRPMYAPFGLNVKQKAADAPRANGGQF